MPFSLSVSITYYRKERILFAVHIGAPIYWGIYVLCDNRRREPNLFAFNLQILVRGFFFLFGANYNTSLAQGGLMRH
jgi:hypothetical protein